MSTRKETYLIYGLKFGEEFTNEFWNKEFRDEMEWDETKPFEKPFFLTDGMNGDYTYFGYIKQLSKGGDYEDYEEIEINQNVNKEDLENKFYELYPELTMPEIKLYYVPHWV